MRRPTNPGSSQKRKQRANDVAFTVRYIVTQMRDLCMDNAGRMTHIEAVDDVMEDLTGVKAFAQRLNMSRTVEQFIGVVQQVGVNPVLDLLHNDDLYEAMRQLVMVSERVRYLKKAIKKADRRLQDCDRTDPKRDKYRKQIKDLTHELKYLRKTYKGAIVTMQAMLGVQTGADFGDYREKFSFLKSFADKGGRRHFDDFDYLDGVDDFLDDPIFSDINGRGYNFGRERRRGRNPIDELAGFGQEMRSSTYRIEDFDDEDSYDDDDDSDLGPDQDALLKGLGKLNSNMDRILAILLSNGSFAVPPAEKKPEPLIKNPDSATIGDLASAFNTFGANVDHRITKVEDQVVRISNAVLGEMDDAGVYTADEAISQFDVQDPTLEAALRDSITPQTETVEADGDIPADAPEPTAPYHPHTPVVPQRKAVNPAVEAAKRDAGTLATSRAEVLSAQTDFEKSQSQ